MKKKRNKKPIYLQVRLPQIRQTGGAHQTEKGGKYRRGLEKKKIRKEIKAELN